MEPLNVILLVQAHCAFCESAKAMLVRLSADYPLSVFTLPLESEVGQEIAAKHGILFAPGILVNGEALCYGRPSERKLRREFERRFKTSEQ
ncbi:MULTISPECIES: glutaredoxin [Ralstonia]|jgi:glutaredoxin|uniref:Thioredoxin family protein n=3 Tax=Pseudomonadota TaxID=1224 RepID=A0AAD2BTT6_9RALS|nr:MULTISPECIES: glutaredoxin [Ralstonia]MCK8653285.1 thioredoxin family protein [Ralstonia insidiosa]CAJ0804024.1 hypothetical protein R77560_04005 [Ralstonia sp. LMG 18095]